jgi:hypothetical protein
LREIDKSLDSVIDIGAIHQRAIAILSEAEIERWNAVTDSILREYDDVVREIQLEAVRSSIAGYESIQGAARAMRESLASRGITSITDKAGRKWSISEYADMAAHTATMRAKNEATINRLLEHDIKLCRLSGHTKSCSRCAPWEGKTLSITGEDREYPSLADARAAGVFHPRCKHTITAAL